VEGLETLIARVSRSGGGAGATGRRRILATTGGGMMRFRAVVAALLVLALLPAASFGRAKPDCDLAKKIAMLEERIRILEERIRALEMEIGRLAGQPIPIPPRGRESGDPWMRLAIGMSREHVRSLLGPPDEIAPHSYLEIWDYSRSYGAPCSVTFDEEGRVESWMAPR
jgi:hypothetical protein